MKFTALRLASAYASVRLFLLCSTFNKKIYNWSGETKPSNAKTTSFWHTIKTTAQRERKKRKEGALIKYKCICGLWNCREVFVCCMFSVAAMFVLNNINKSRYIHFIRLFYIKFHCIQTNAAFSLPTVVRAKIRIRNPGAMFTSDTIFTSTKTLYQPPSNRMKKPVALVFAAFIH